MIPYSNFADFPLLWPLVILLVLGLVLLCLGGEWLARGAASLALNCRINPVIIGLTVVSIATSFPELVTALIASVEGSSGLAVGNIVGSNLGNIGLILGVAALLYPVRVQLRLIKQEVPILLGITLIFSVMAYGGISDGQIGRFEGLVLLACMVAYLVFLVRKARDLTPEIEREFAEQEELAKAVRSTGKSVLLVLGGGVLLWLGAEFLVGSSTQIARALNVSDVLIGLTIVALGTSLPELAASIAAAAHKQSDIVAGNIVGSNIFNLLLIGGFVSTVYPLQVQRRLLFIEFPAMLVLTVLLWFIFRSGREVSRREGVVLLGLYALVITLASLSQLGLLF